MFLDHVGLQQPKFVILKMDLRKTIIAKYKGVRARMSFQISKGVKTPKLDKFKEVKDNRKPIITKIVPPEAIDFYLDWNTKYCKNDRLQRFFNAFPMVQTREGVIRYLFAKK